MLPLIVLYSPFHSFPVFYIHRGTKVDLLLSLNWKNTVCYSVHTTCYKCASYLHCLLLLVDNRVVFESVKYPGEHIGVLESGDTKKPRSTGTGRHAQFQPKNIREVCTVAIVNTLSMHCLPILLGEFLSHLLA